MHVLIIPSEEFVPAGNELAGIFQYHQAVILKQKNNTVGVISIKQSLSVPMVVKALLFRLFNIKVKNELRELSPIQIWKKGWNKLFHIDYFIRKEIIENIPVIRVDGFYYNKPKENENDFGWIKAGIAAFKQYSKLYGQPDIIHAHNALYAGMLAMKIKKQFGIHYILTEHNTAYARQMIQANTQKKKIKKSFLAAGALLAVSPAFCDLLNNMFELNRFQYLPNVLDPYLEAKPNKEDLKNNNEFRFLHIAELHPKKDQVTLLKAFNLLASKIPGITLYIGGSGEMDNILKDYTIKNNIQEKVIFCGTLSRDEVYSNIINADSFVLSSLFETFGVVVIEAMLFGKPVIVTKCGGPENFVNEFCGYIVNPQDPEQLSLAMEKMISEYKNFNSDRIRNYTIQSFGSEQFYKNIMTVYQKNINKNV